MTAAESTFRAIAEEWIEKLTRECRAEQTLKKKRWLLKFAIKAFGDRPISQITPSELLAVLRLVEQRGHYESAQRLRSTCGQVFRYALVTGRAERDPTSDLRGALTVQRVKHRPALSPIRRPSGRCSGQLTAMTGTKQPKTRYGWPFLSSCALESCVKRSGMNLILIKPNGRYQRTRQRCAGYIEYRCRDRRSTYCLTFNLVQAQAAFLFPSLRTRQRPMSENTLNAALRRLGYSKDEHRFSVAPGQLADIVLGAHRAKKRQSGCLRNGLKDAEGCLCRRHRHQLESRTGKENRELLACSFSPAVHDHHGEVHETFRRAMYWAGQ